jgi:hypothetical protein
LLNPIVPFLAEVEGGSFLIDESPFKQVELSRVCEVHVLPVDGSSVRSIDSCSVLSIEGSSE